MRKKSGPVGGGGHLDCGGESMEWFGGRSDWIERIKTRKRGGRVTPPPKTHFGKAEKEDKKET